MLLERIQSNETFRNRVSYLQKSTKFKETSCSTLCLYHVYSSSVSWGYRVTKRTSEDSYLILPKKEKKKCKFNRILYIEHTQLNHIMATHTVWICISECTINWIHPEVDIMVSYYVRIWFTKCTLKIHVLRRKSRNTSSKNKMEYNHLSIS